MNNKLNHDNTYLNLLRTIISNGVVKKAARENMPSTKSLFGTQVSYDMNDGFPLLTTKKMHFKGIVAELLWFLRGDTNIKYLVDNNVNIWNEDSFNYYIKRLKIAGAPEETQPLSFEEFILAVKEDWQPPAQLDNYRYGDCGHQYGKVWRHWETNKSVDAGDNGFQFVDQILSVLLSLFKTPESRRHIVTAIDPAHDQDLALYWCHAMFQFNTFLDEDGVVNLDLYLNQRSCDVVLGCPYNLSSYSLLLHIFGEILGFKPNRFIHSFGDVHIYDNHVEAVNTQIGRTPYPSPTLFFSNSVLDIFHQIRTDLKNDVVDSDKLTGYFNQMRIEDFSVENYESHPAIKAVLSTGMKK
jgi:thymidylate synthase